MLSTRRSGLKSTLTSAKLSLARAHEAEEEEDAESAANQNSSNAMHSVFRLVGALVLFLVLLLCAAYVLWIYERPIEEKAQLADAAERVRWRNIIARLFRFIAVPGDDNLTGTTCAEAYNDVPTIFPDYDHVAAPEQWVLVSDNSTVCSGSTSDTGATCHLTCILEQPTVEQVSNCRIVDDDDYNPALFDSECLASSETCPNCHLLTVSLQQLQFMGSAGIETGVDSTNRQIQLAELYTMYHNRLEVIAPKTHWDSRGSLFFAFTVLTAVGYGSYVPAAVQSKIAITIATIPGIVIFAYALGLFAGIVMNLVTYLKVSFGFSRARAKVSRRARVWANTLSRCDTDGNGELTLDELITGADAICRIIGIDVGGENGGMSRVSSRHKLSKDDTADETSSVASDDGEYFQAGTLGATMAKQKARGPSNSVNEQAQLEAREFITAAFEDADVEKKGYVTMMESMAMVSDLVRVRETQLSEQQATEQLKAAVFCFLPLVVVAAYGFLEFEKQAGNGEYTVLDSFYFVVVSLTTVGLGDIVPSEGYSQGFWYVWMTIGLGLVALIFSTAGAIIANASARYELMAFRGVSKEKGGGKGGEEKGKTKIPNIKVAKSANQTSKPKTSKVAPSPVREVPKEFAPVERDNDDVEKAFQGRENSKWGRKSPRDSANLS
tara:strand:- start:6120 stop:8117 length:1998 start_codon:yes stop_codon:yes gene_type:complete